MIFVLEYNNTSLIVISYSVRLRVARSTQMGTCQSLKKRDEQQIQTLTLFVFNDLYCESDRCF